MSDIPFGPFPELAGFGEAEALDGDDPLAEHRTRYVDHDPDLIYLDGNSLGRLPRSSSQIVADVVDEQWGKGLIGSWNEVWWDLQLVVGDQIAPLIGARAGEVVVSDSTSVNLYKLAVAALRHLPGRHKVVSDDLNFPTDLYILRGAAEAHGARLVVVPSDGISGPLEELEKEIDADTALVSLSHAVFKSGYVYDLGSLTESAHRAGALMLWDLSHSVGVVPVDLCGTGADLAVGCTYKYLNGGPGSPAFLYVRADLQEQLSNPINAWWGHAEPFAFELDFRPAAGIRRFHTGTMPIISLAAVQGGIEDVARAGIDAIRAKSVSLTEFLIQMWEQHLAPLGFVLASPRDPSSRGGHISLAHPDSWAIATAMIELTSVIPDFRAPDNIRLAPAPLYTSHVDVHTAVGRIKRLVESDALSGFAGRRVTVT